VTEPLALRPYQIEDLGWHIANPRSLNESHPGTGKTPTMCVLAYFHWARRGKKTVWAMPKSLMRKNKKELLRFTTFRDEDVEIFHTDHKKLTASWKGPTFVRQKRTRVATGKLGPDGAPRMKTAYVDEPAADLIAASNAKVFICTFAFLRAHWQRLIESHPDIDLVLTDEHHLGYKSNDSEQTKSLYHIMKHATNCCFMTGSLIDGALDHAFPAIHIIEPRYYGSHQGFLAAHAGFIDDYGRVQVWQNEEKIRRILERHSRRHTFEEVYGEEPVVFFHEEIEMGTRCREAYDQFHEQAMLELENAEFLDGTLPGVATIRARQIMAHPETMGIAKGEITGKDERLAVFAGEGQPMLIFAALKPEQQRIQQLLTSLGLRAGLINSDVSANRRNEIDLAFQESRLDAIVASGPTAGVGYNWERADHVIYVSVDYQDVNFIQSYRRASRGTRTTTLRVTSLAYEDSIDQRMYAILKAKSELANRVDSTRRVLAFAA